MEYLFFCVWLISLNVFKVHPCSTCQNFTSFVCLLVIYLFIWLLRVLVAACGIFSFGMRTHFFFFKYKFIYLFIFWLHWAFVAVRRLSLVVASGGYASCGARASHCGGFSLLRSTGSMRAGFSSCGSRALERRLSSCRAQA